MTSLPSLPKRDTATFHDFRDFIELLVSSIQLPPLEQVLDVNILWTGNNIDQFPLSLTVEGHVASVLIPLIYEGKTRQGTIDFLTNDRSQLRRIDSLVNRTVAEAYIHAPVIETYDTWDDVALETAPSLP